MDGGKMHERKIGSGKTAISSYRGRIVEGSPTMKEFQTNYPEKHNAKSRELHLAKRDTTQFNEHRELAESLAAEAESKLSAAKKTVKDLTLRIEESNSRAKAQMGDLEMAKRREEEWNSENFECMKVLRELETIKRKLSKLKLDMASILEEKRIAEKEMESSLYKTQSLSNSIEALTKKVEEVNEEHVLVELARIEAVKECREIEAQRRGNAEKYSASMEETQRKKQNLIQEIENGKDLETKLAITMSDMNMLERKLKEMDKGPEIKEPALESLLDSVMKELENLNKELVLVKEECFQFMASINVIQNEIRHVTEEKARLNKKEEKADMAIESINSEILKAKSDMEEKFADEDKAKTVSSNLYLTLKQLKSEAEAAKTEQTLISKETAIIKAEIQRTETEIDSAEERLQAAMQDLKAVKSSEEKALENLKEVADITMRNRASASQCRSTITISKFEYEYLMGHAAKAKEIADKKVAAAQAWIEALKASEKEIMIKTEISRKVTRELMVEKELGAKKIVENDFEKWKKKMEPEKLQPDIGFPSKVMNRSVKNTPARRAKVRKSASPVIRGIARSMSFSQKEKKTYAKPSLVLQSKGQ
ncbi:hypothetical protein ACJIZ3_002305 [Penstemon smallii]|uniref:Protein PLASTID MOVEMENT IMPAIRED 2 n=1 Tax=Penstemon smallii TaxID=265156 RepID=A0ABD3U784_9LAMI